MSTTGQSAGTGNLRSFRGMRSHQKKGRVFKKIPKRRREVSVKAVPSPISQQEVVSEVEDVMNDMINTVENEDTPCMSFDKIFADSVTQPPPIFVPTKHDICSPFSHCSYWPTCDPYLIIHNLCPPPELPHDYPPLPDLEFDNTSLDQATTHAQPCSPPHTISQSSTSPEPSCSSHSQHTYANVSAATPVATNVSVPEITPRNSLHTNPLTIETIPNTKIPTGTINTPDTNSSETDPPVDTNKTPKPNSCTDDVKSTKSTNERLKFNNLDGCRIINLECLAAIIMTTSCHIATCDAARFSVQGGGQALVLEGEVNRFGLASILACRCKGCGKLFRLETQKKVRDPNGILRYEVNMAAVWGGVAAGIGGAKLNEILGTAGVPGMDRKTFCEIEHRLGGWFTKVLEKEMRLAAEEEKQRAIQLGHYHNGVPYITVILDGGWSKRSHKHSYNALGGVGVIIGAFTKKLLHVGVKVKYCAICSRYDKLGEKKSDKPPHECFKNWDASSRQMESQVILEGFLEAETKFGMKYLRYVGDGDSSVHARLISEGPDWCRSTSFQKIECANHCCKCFRTALEKLVTDNPSYKGKGKLTKLARVRMTGAMRAAIKVHSLSHKAGNSKAALDLRNEILNIPLHVFGYHEKCSAHFCKVVQGKLRLGEVNSKDCDTETHSKLDNCDSGSGTDHLDNNATVCNKGIDITSFGNTTQNTDNHNDNGCTSTSFDESHYVSNILGDQALFWTEGMGEEDLLKSRGQCLSEKMEIDSKMYVNIYQIVLRYANKADKLLDNETTNLAEMWMNIRSKFDGGKQINKSTKVILEY